MFLKNEICLEIEGVVKLFSYLKINVDKKTRLTCHKVEGSGTERRIKCRTQKREEREEYACTNVLHRDKNYLLSLFVSSDKPRKAVPLHVIPYTMCGTDKIMT